MTSNPRLSPADLARAEELCSRATAEPWTWDLVPDVGLCLVAPSDHCDWCKEHSARVVFQVDVNNDFENRAEDREFCAAARSLLPAALADLRGAREEVVRLRAALKLIAESDADTFAGVTAREALEAHP